MTKTTNESIRQKWQSAWTSSAYKNKFVAGIVVLVTILSLFPYFFQFIQKRNGVTLHDWILPLLPLHDASLPIFLIIWSVSLLVIIRVVQEPNLLLVLLWTYILICVTRILTIYFFPLNPPADLLPLADPITNMFYGPTYVTKDLFFSGHTASVFLMFLCLRRRSDKIIAGLATLTLAILLMIQRVHYTIDILAAVVITYFLYLLARRILGKEGIIA